MGTLIAAVALASPCKVLCVCGGGAIGLLRVVYRRVGRVEQKKKPPPPPCLAANKKNWKKDGPMRNVRSRN